MAQLGSFIPAKSAKIGLVGRVFARIVRIGSAGSAYSSFSIDGSQINMMLNNQTPRSLLLIDEFGKGTAPEDGVSLLAATIRHLASQPEPPRVLITTHFQELLRFDLLFPSHESSHDHNIQVMQMAMQQNQQDNDAAHMFHNTPMPTRTSKVTGESPRSPSDCIVPHDLVRKTSANI